MELDYRNTAAAGEDADRIKADLKSRYIKRLVWLSEMRWFATGAVSLAVVLAAALRLDLPLTQMLVSLTVLIATNLFYSASNQKLNPEHTHIKTIFSLFYLEVFTDFLILIWFIHLSGGVENLFAFCFVFHIVIASVMVPSRINFGLAGAATGLVAAMALSEYRGWLPHYTLGRFAPGAAALKPEYIIYFVAAFAVVMFITAYVSSALGAMLKRREEYLSRLHGELRDWNVQIRQANERLIDIDRTKTDFMRMSAHEIRSPMAAMLSILNTIIGGYVEDREKIISLLKLGAARANDALKLSSDLLALAREKSRDIEPENIDAGREVLNIAAEFEAQALEKGIALETELPPAPLRSIFDRGSLGLALRNILENAIKYSPDHAGPVRVSLVNRAGKLFLEVSDHGIGIYDEDGEKIFQEFFRATNAHEHAHIGTGLGLSIAKRAAENLGGTITFTSRISEGTTFTLSWPYAER